MCSAVDTDQEEDNEYVEAEDDDESGNESGDDENELKKKLSEIEAKLSEDFVSQLDKDKGIQEKFLGTFGVIIGKKPPDRVDNVLHFMAGKRAASSFLIQYIITEHEDRMEDMDNAQRQPLTLAIESNKEIFIRTVLLNSRYNDEKLVKILMHRSSDEGNGIHKAIKNVSDSELLVDLIKKASSSVLEATDGEGCTPLHRAVEYKRCTNSQYQIVEALLERGESALDKKNKSGLSVYQYHLKTRLTKGKGTAGVAARSKSRPYRKADTQSFNHFQEVVGNHGSERNNSMIKKGLEIPNDSLPTEPLDVGPVPTIKRIGTPRQADGIKDGVSNLATSVPNNQANISRKAMSTPLSTTERPIGPANVPSLASPNYPKNEIIQQKGSGKVSKKKPLYNEKFADEIADQVKLQYLRSTFRDNKRDHDTAVDFLYGGGQTKHIHFNLLDNYKPLSDSLLKSGSYSRFEFDTALQLVAVGPITTPQSGELTMSRSGRQDVVMLLRWLKEVKGVRNIIKVIIDDHKSPFHRDEAMIQVLKSLRIEILDWNKPDLCPETIRAACQHVRELHLSWSGLNGMLLAWGGTDGLAKLPKLTDVYLRQISNHESEKWATEKIVEFQTRLKNTRDSINAGNDTQKLPKITVHPPSDQTEGNRHHSRDTPGPEPNKEITIKSHQWLEYMDRFASGIFTMSPDSYIKSITNPPTDITRDVRICLIDDGVHISHKSISERMDVHYGRAFGAYTEEQYRGIRKPFYDSTTNHGTLMASMMTRVCPFVKIVPYRLDTGRGDDSRIHFTAKSAAEALEYAIKQDFDIISMSWTIKEETGQEGNTKEVERIKDALRRATRTKLVFCSSPDVGDLEIAELKSYVPVGLDDAKSLFRIGAARADNTPWSPTGGREAVDYVLPGHDVCEREGCEIDQANGSPKSGSSIATALAAGLAALMIHIVRMAVIHTYKHNLQDSDQANIPKLDALRFIKSPAAMRKIFDSMTAANKMYVHVWGDFNQRGLDLKAADETEDSEVRKWKIIGELARDIVSPKNISDMGKS